MILENVANFIGLTERAWKREFENKRLLKIDRLPSP